VAQAAKPSHGRGLLFFSFPEDARWNTDRQAVEFEVEIGEYWGVVRVPRRVFQRLLTERPTPERCIEAYYLQRTRFESIASGSFAGGIDRGRECRDQRAGLALGRLLTRMFSDRAWLEG
jgi:hypothetical protein